MAARIVRLAGARVGLQCRKLHATAAVWRDFVIPVPQMAESITEGTVAQVTKQPGQAVALDEVVCVLETDKVAFEVRSPEAGVVKSIAVQAGQNVGVGAPIMTLDTDGNGSAASPPSAAAPAPSASSGSSHSSSAAQPAPAPSPPASAASLSSASHHRVPSIRFRHGARDTINAELGLAAAEPAPAPAPTSSKAPPSQQQQQQQLHMAPGSWAEAMAKAFPSKATRSYLDLPPAYGRPRVSEAEARAIESGGAY